jgi:hypothetical protein
MSDRQIFDNDGNIAFRLQRYVWRSKPTKSPLTGRHVRCIVAQDEKGQYWAGTRIGRGDGRKAEHELWEQCETKQQAMAISRQQVRGFLSTDAEFYSETVTGKKPDEKIVRVTMDDGWSVAINAPEPPSSPSPAFVRVMKMFKALDNKKEPAKRLPSRAGRRGIDR